MQKPEPASQKESPQQLSARSVANAGLSVLMFSVLVFSCTRTLIEPDLYWHLQMGIDICKTGAIVTPNTFTFFTSNQPVLSPNWLADLIYGFTYMHFGYPVLVILKAVLVGLMLVIVYKVISHWEFDSFGKSLLLLAVAFFASPATNCIRPHVFSDLFMAILFVLFRIAKNNRKVLWCLPIMFLAWEDLHAGFIIGLITVFVWTVAESYTYLRNRKSEGEGSNRFPYFYWLIWGLCCSATFFTPFGFTYPLFVLMAATHHYPGISEWLPIELVSLLGGLWAAMLVVTIFCLFKSKKPKDVSLTVVWLMFAIAPLIALRHLQFLGIATALLVGEHLASTWHQLRSASRVADRKWALPDALFLIISVGLAGWLIFTAVAQIWTIRRYVPGEPIPERSMAILQRIKAHGNMIVNHDWGAYSRWHLQPAVKISYDPRYFAYTEAEHVANDSFTSGVGPWDTLLEKFPIDIVLVSPATPAYNLMKLKQGWELVYEDDISALFFPTGSSQGKEVKQLLKSLPGGAQNPDLTTPLL